MFNFFVKNGYKTFRVNKDSSAQLNGLEKVTDIFAGLTRKTADHFFCPQELAYQFQPEIKLEVY